MENLVSVFVGEATELLEDLEKALLHLETDKANKLGISEVFRIMHSLKGSANMFGFEAINNLTHNLETIYQSIRDSEGELTLDIFNVTLACLDHLRALLADPSLDNSQLRDVHHQLLDEISNLTTANTVMVNTKPDANAVKSVSTYYITFKPFANSLQNGTNTLYLIDDLMSLGDGVALPYFTAVPEWNSLSPELSFSCFEIVLCTDKNVTDIRDVFMFMEGDCELEVILLKADFLLSEQNKQKLKSAHSFEKNISVDTVRELILASEKKSVTQKASRNKNVSNVRVSSDRLDELMSLVSELVTTQAGLSLWAEKNNSPHLIAIAETVEKLTRRLRDNAFSMSLIPVENLVVRFQRLVRDLSKELGKDVDFKTEGTETEIDKSVIEKLSDPIMHLIRNGLDHGIESPLERERLGKPRKGTIHFKAYYSGANVVIEITDDGAGINYKKVMAKALEKKLIATTDELSEQEIINLIFLPGFSTSDTITEVSGRGVGMDVVRRNITDIRGEIDVTSKAGFGSTFTIRIPLTLSIIDGLLVKIGDSDFVLPLSMVEKCYEVNSTMLTDQYNNWVTLDGERVPYFNLRDDFDASGTRPEHSQVIKISTPIGQIGLAVDKIIGDYQAVLKPLGQFYRDQEQFSGATILGDGTVALVIDPLKLIEKLRPV